jgi:hypothetical protein
VFFLAACAATPTREGATPTGEAPTPTGEAAGHPELVGTWYATTGDPPGITAVFNNDGTFTWSNGDLSGTYEADGSTLTFSYPDDSTWCPGGTFTWDYEVSGDILTSDVVGAECPPAAPIESGPPASPDWIFEPR